MRWQLFPKNLLGKSRCIDQNIFLAKNQHFYLYKKLLQYCTTVEVTCYDWKIMKVVMSIENSLESYAISNHQLQLTALICEKKVVTLVFLKILWWNNLPITKGFTGKQYRSIVC